MANDAYEVYFAEKLWELIPAVYRDEDGRGDPPGALRAIVEIVAAEAARLRRSQDRLWDDSFIELCDDWAVPYVGDLVATRPLSALNPRGRRIDVAKTIYYRRRKGTPRVLEELIVDIAGWEGVLREGFSQLARARHRLDPPPGFRIGRFSATPQGGVADLRNARAAEMVGGPFGEFAHTPDVRPPSGLPVPGPALGGLPGLHRHRGALCTAGIRKVGFHIWRLGSWELEGVRPALVDGTTGFTFDPSGRDVPLFQRASREKGGSQGISGTGFAEWFAAQEWEVPAPIRCRVLGHEEYLVSEAALAALDPEPGFTAVRLGQLRRLVGRRLHGIGGLRRAVGLLPAAAFFTGAAPLQALRRATLTSDCGKAALLPGSVTILPNPPAELAVERISAGSLAGWSAAPAGFRAVVDPERGRLRFVGAAPPAALRVRYHFGLPGPVGAGSYPRPAAAVRTPGSTLAGGGPISAADLPDVGIIEIADSDSYDIQPNATPIRDLVLQAAEGRRPYLRRGTDWVLQSAGSNAELTLDGLWIGATAALAIRIEGSFRTVRLHDSTLDPGGPQTADQGSPVLPAVEVVVAGEIDRMEIQRSIVGRITVAANGAVNRLVIRDSIVQAGNGAPAIRQRLGETILERATVMGTLDLHRLYATETLIAGQALVRDNQVGCFRYSAAGEGSRLPRPYRSHVLSSARALFSSRRFGNPGFGQLSLAAPEGVRLGAESGSEIGAFSAVNGPIRLDGLRAKAAEYMPFGLVPFFVAES